MCPYGFRPNRRAHDVIAEHSPPRLPGPVTIMGPWRPTPVGASTKSGHVVLMDRFRRRIKDKKVCALVKAFLKRPGPR